MLDLTDDAFIITITDGHAVVAVTVFASEPRKHQCNSAHVRSVRLFIDTLMPPGSCRNICRALQWISLCMLLSTCYHVRALCSTPMYVILSSRRDALDRSENRLVRTRCACACACACVCACVCWFVCSRLSSLTVPIVTDCTHAPNHPPTDGDAQQHSTHNGSALFQPLRLT